MIYKLFPSKYFPSFTPHVSPFLCNLSLSVLLCFQMTFCRSLLLFFCFPLNIGGYCFKGVSSLLSHGIFRGSQFVGEPQYVEMQADEYIARFSPQCSFLKKR